MSHVTYERVMSHMNESCLIWMRHVSYEWVMSHINESCHVGLPRPFYNWFLNPMLRFLELWNARHGITVPDSGQGNRNARVIYALSDILTNSYVTWLIHVCHDSFICDVTTTFVKWLVYRWHDSFMKTLTIETRMLHRDWVISHLTYGVPTISRLLKFVGLFCRILSLL